MLHLNLSTIARLGLYILSPCLAFSSLSHSRINGGDALGLVVIVVIVTLILWVIGSTTGLFLKFDERKASAFLLATLFMNAGNYGVPLNDLAFGRTGREFAVICFVTQQVLFNTLALWLATRGKLGFHGAIRQVLRMPVTYSVPAAVLVVVLNIPVPAPIDKGISLLGDAALPIILLSLGLQLAETRPDIRDGARMGLAVAYRLALSPALAALAVLLLTPLFGMSGLAAKVLIVEMAMPTAVTVVLLSIEFEADSRFVSGVVFFSTLLSAISLTFILTLLI
jgi:predicted permease